MNLSHNAWLYNLRDKFMNAFSKSVLLILSAALMTMTVPAQEKQVYGWELMTEQERVEHRNKMRSFETSKEREQYRKEHHERMKQRAKERGVTLPDEPPQRGKGMGRGQGGGPR